MSTGTTKSASKPEEKQKAADTATTTAADGAITKGDEQKSLKTILTSEAMLEQFSKALPRHLSADRFVRICTTALLRTPLLMECTHESFFRCLLDLSAMGLEPDGIRAHLIPYRNNHTGTVECTLLIDYKGLVEIVRRSDNVSRIHADIVCPDDIFEFNAGSVIRHTWDLKKERGATIAAYAMVVAKDGTNQAVVLQKHEIDSVRERSKSKSNGPWVTDYNEMAKKGLALDTPIPTPDGWTTMGELQVGSMVFDKDGKPTSVVAVSEVKNLPCFRVNFTNGDSVVCDDEHRWLARCGTSNANQKKYSVITVNQMYDAISDGMSVTIPVQKPLDLPDAELPLDPYLLGYWLGDGSAKAAAITCGKDDLPHVLDVVKKSKFQLGTVKADKRSQAHCVRIKGGFLVLLRAMGLLGNKHIPEEYLRASVTQRLSLLRGLMDSDGHIDIDRGRAHFSTTNRDIADAVYELVLSLGDIPWFQKRKNVGFGKECRSFLVGWKPTVCPVTIPRKVKNFTPRKIAAYRSVASVIPIESVPTKCIAVESLSETYLAGRTMAVTHNTAFRRLCKWLTLSPEVLQHISDDDEAEFGAHYRQQNSSRALLSHDKKVKPLNPFEKGGASDEGN